MQELTIPSLPEIKFDSVPTEEEIVKTLQDVEQFFTKLSGVLFLTGKYGIVDDQQRMNKLLGSCASLRQTRDAFMGRANIAVPQLQMRPQ